MSTDRAERRRTPLRPGCGQPHACPAPVRRQVLSRVPLLTGLSAAELDGIDRRLVSLAWAEGENLYDAGAPAEHLYVLASGRAKAFRRAADGQEVVVDLLAPGDLVGAVHTTGQAVHTETVRSLTTTCALRIDRTTFREILVEHPRGAGGGLDETTALLAEARSDVAQRSGAPVPQRVAGTLLRLAGKFGQERPDGSTLIQVPLSRHDLAGMTGSTPESVSRVMSRLRSDGVVDSGRRWTAVLDRARLAALADPPS